MTSRSQSKTSVSVCVRSRLLGGKTFLGLLVCCTLLGCYNWRLPTYALPAEAVRASAYLTKLGIPAKPAGRQVYVRGPGKIQARGIWMLPYTMVGKGFAERDAWRELGRCDSEEELGDWTRQLTDAGIEHGVCRQSVVVRPADSLLAREVVGEEEVDNSYVLVIPEGTWKHRHRLKGKPVEPRSFPGQGIYVKAIDQLRALGFDNVARSIVWDNHFFRLELDGGGGEPVALSEEEARDIVELLDGAKVHAFRIGKAVYYRPSCLEVCDSVSSRFVAERLIFSWLQLRGRAGQLENSGN